MKPLLPVSVTVCTYNESKNIAACLEHIKNNSPAEIIVVDGGSTDDTVAIAEALGVKVVHSSKKGLASQRQAGLDAAGQEFIAIVDGDDQLDEHFLQTSLSQLSEFGFDAIQGRARASNPDSYCARAMAHMSAQSTAGESVRDTQMIGRPALYRAQALRHCGFDSFFDGAGDEDVDLSIRMEMAGFKQGQGTAKSTRYQDEEFFETLKKYLKYGRGDARIIYKFPHKRRRIIAHQLFQYPIRRGFAALFSSGYRYFPMYVLQGWGRFFALSIEYIKLRFNRPPHGPYPVRTLGSNDCPTND